MKYIPRSCLIFVVITLMTAVVWGQTSAFTYNGRLTNGGSPANGSYEFEFKLFATATGGSALATQTGVPATVTNGIFNVNLDFGALVFDGSDRFLEVAVRVAGGGAYTTFPARQNLTSTPYTIRALTAATAGDLNCTACVQDAHINTVAGSKVTGTVANATNLGGQPASTYVRSDRLKSPMQIARLAWWETSRPLNYSFIGLPVPGQPATSGQLYAPASMTFDGRSIFIADGFRVRKFNSDVGSSVTHTAFAAEGTVPDDEQVYQMASDGSDLWIAYSNQLIVGDEIPSGIYRYGTRGRDRIINEAGWGLVFDGRYIWATLKSGVVVKIEPDGNVLCSVNIGGTPKGIAFDGENIWVAGYSQNVIHKVSGNCSLLQSIPAPNKPYAVIFDGTSIWATLEENPPVRAPGPTNVIKIDPRTGTVVNAVAAGAQPHGIGFDGMNIWIANNGSNTVTKIRASDATVVKTYPVGIGPEAILYDGSNIWVSNTGGNANNVLTRFF